MSSDVDKDQVALEIVPEVEISAAVKLLDPTAPEKTTVYVKKGEDPAFVGSDCPAAWLIVTVKAAVEYVTMLEDVDAPELPLPAGSVMPPDARIGCKVPSPDAVAATVHVILSEVDTAQVTPVADPLFEISAAVKELGLIASLNTKVKFTGTELVFAPPERANEEIVGTALSWVYETRLVQENALLRASVAMP